MELVRWVPFDGMNRLHSRINYLFDESVGRERTLPSATAGAWLSPVDILESKEAHLIRAELTGMNKEDFNLESQRWYFDAERRAQIRRLEKRCRVSLNRAAAWQVFAILRSAADRQAGRYQGHRSRGDSGDRRAESRGSEASPNLHQRELIRLH